MTDKLVSILIPCYNHEQFLDDCLGSILAQDYENIELLICDDCSPDGSFAKILSYEQQLKQRFPRVEILKNQVNCGVTKNVNRMLSMAKGDYIKTIASDDAMAPNAISAMVRYLQENPSVDVVVTNGVTVPEEQHYPDFHGTGKIYSAAPNFSADGFFERVARRNEISAPAAMVRMSVYEKYGFYDETVKVEDYEFWLRVLQQGATRFGFLDKDLLYYRINANSMTSLSANAGLARRRKLIHESEIGTLQKFRSCLRKQAYSEIVVQRIAAEWWMAVQYDMTDWEKELHQSWKHFDGWKDLPLNKKVWATLFSWKQALKKSMKRTGLGKRAAR